eukprot:COSAG05_NODE_1867_length_3930_cov_3.096842_5_plen_146_part_00
MDKLNPEDALTHPCRPFWVAEIPGQATRADMHGCVIQVTVARHIKPEAIVERFDQDQMDMFFILWMVRPRPDRLALPRPTGVLSFAVCCMVVVGVGGRRNTGWPANASPSRRTATAHARTIGCSRCAPPPVASFRPSRIRGTMLR